MTGVPVDTISIPLFAALQQTVETQAAEIMEVHKIHCCTKNSTNITIGRRALSTHNSIPTAVGTADPLETPADHLRSKLDRLYRNSNISMPDPLNKGDHPGVMFWEERLWIEWVQSQKERGGFALGVPGRGINSSWMEDFGGNRVDLTRQKVIKDEVRETWDLMALSGIPLDVYSNTPTMVLDYFRARMASRFKELQLCTNHWKVDKLWQEAFSNSKYRPGKATESGARRRNTGRSTNDAHRGGPSEDTDNGGSSEQVSVFQTICRPTSNMRAAKVPSRAWKKTVSSSSFIQSTWF